MTRTTTAGSLRPGDRILDPSDGTPATVVRTIGGAPLIGLHLTADTVTPGAVDPYQRVLTLTDPVTLADDTAEAAGYTVEQVDRYRWIIRGPAGEVCESFPTETIAREALEFRHQVARMVTRARARAVAAAVREG